MPLLNFVWLLLILGLNCGNYQKYGLTSPRTVTQQSMPEGPRIAVRDPPTAAGWLSQIKPPLPHQLFPSSYQLLPCLWGLLLSTVVDQRPWTIVCVCILTGQQRVIAWNRCSRTIVVRWLNEQPMWKLTPSISMTRTGDAKVQKLRYVATVYIITQPNL